MKKIVIELSDQQHEIMLKEMQRCQKINAEEETFSGMEFNLITTDDGIMAYLDFKMLSKIEIGEVNWEII